MFLLGQHTEADTAVVQESQSLYQAGRRIWQYNPHGSEFEGIVHAGLRRSCSTAKVRYYVLGLENLRRGHWTSMNESVKMTL